MTSRRSGRSRGFSRLELTIVLGVTIGLLALLIPAINSARNDARRHQSKNNLKYFGLAFHNYHDVYGILPPGSTIAPDGTAHHVWSTSIMPYLDASPMFNMINFDYPWDDSIHVTSVRINSKDYDSESINSDVTNRDIFKTYRYEYIATIPGGHPTQTTDGYGLMHYPANPRAFYRNSSVTLDDFSSGTANGWLVGEATGDYEPWGAPFNWRDWNEPLNSSETSYGRPTADGALFLFADGSVRFISNEDAAVSQRVLNGWLPAVEPDAVHKPPRNWEYVR